MCTNISSTVWYAETSPDFDDDNDFSSTPVFGRSAGGLWGSLASGQTSPVVSTPSADRADRSYFHARGDSVTSEDSSHSTQFAPRKFKAPFVHTSHTVQYQSFDDECGIVLGIRTFSNVADHAARNWVGVDPSAAVFDMFLRDGAIFLDHETGLSDENLQGPRCGVCVQETERDVSSRLQMQGGLFTHVRQP